MVASISREMYASSFAIAAAKKSSAFQNSFCIIVRRVLCCLRRVRAHVKANEFGETILSMFLNCVFVGLGGLVGTVLRYLVSLLPMRHESGFPVLTLGINVLGAFLLGLIMAYAGRAPSLDPRALLFLKVGLCGGFTTFSTFALEAHGLLSGGKPVVALLYMVLSVVLCVCAVFGAGALAR